MVYLSKKYLHEFGLASPTKDNQNSNDSYNSLFRRPYDIHESNNCLEVNLPKLVDDQRYVFNVTINSVINNRDKVFVVNAPGGTGKIFLITQQIITRIKTSLINLLLVVRLAGGTALAVTSSDIATTLLNRGRTAHSTFKLLLNVFCDEESVFPIRKNGPLGKILQKTLFVVWDECTMSHRAHIETVDRSLQDLR